MTVDGLLVGHFGVSPIVCEVETGVHIVEACVIDAHPLYNGRRFQTSAYVEVFPGQTIECSYTRLWSGRLTPGRYEAEAARGKEVQARLLIACSPLLALGVLMLIAILLNIITEIA
ncbi:hypothetical protein [Actinomadura fibrosa]|uniref:Uncharacterized protein n=1 Tax=Actinomadura fibrosa TaxID=111802 RepID=A0ABW2XXY7_9ACTN|nr:hypothetical protein [Actinomadura fibrosa]